MLTLQEHYVYMLFYILISNILFADLSYSFVKLRYTVICIHITFQEN
jgi:hypothetical protein